MAEHLTDYHFSTIDIDLKWEQALGYVNIPDMEFVVFEDFEAETALGTTAEDIAAVILEHRSDHEAEFQALKKFISTQRLLGFIPASIQTDHREQELEALQPDYVEGKSKRTSKLGFLHHALTGLSSQKSLTFEKFARLKADLLILKAGTLTDLIAKNAGFTDFDTGRALQITQASPLKITSTTYDFEASELVSQTQNFEIAGRLVDRITSRAAYEFLHYLQGLSPSEKMIFTHMLEAEEIILA